MADPADHAAELTEQHLEQALSTRRQYRGLSLTHCDECGEEIPEARRVALPGVTLCVDCQSEQEVKGRV
jgi:phage/conjugal plasmid C-4 type zinc finger TraR family protein